MPPVPQRPGRKYLKVTRIVALDLPDGRSIQVAGTYEHCAALMDILRLVPQEQRGAGFLYTVLGDADLGPATRAGREIARAAELAYPEVPDVTGETRTGSRHRTMARRRDR